MSRSIFVLFALTLVACDAGRPVPEGDAGAPSLELGEPCSSPTECVSGICVGTDAEGGVCSQRCESDYDCPEGVNWGCVVPGAFPDVSVCGCVPDSASEICSDGVDNDCDGQLDDCRRCGDVLVAGDDDDHCGGCFVECLPDEECRAGECRCVDRGETACGGSCVDLSSDARHCGACDVVCPAGEACVDGACACPPARPDRCAGGCVDLSRDASSCGACGNVCPSGLSCVDGACACPSDRATTCGDECVDLERDGRHCGACGEACEAGFVCRGGSCECGTSTESDRCPGVGCVDLNADPAHCGACGEACPAGLVCRGGVCGCGFEGAPDHCPGVGCVSLQSDAAHCGACGNACPDGMACVAGACACPDSGDLFCGGTCVDPQWNAAHCGACDAACLPGERCVGGRCECPSGLVCDGVCEAVGPSNCGACGVTCRPGEVCSGGACRCFVFGQTYCGDGCYDLSRDPQHCGACGNACGTGQSCAGGVCACPRGQDWCPSAGRCVDLRSDAAHCGACDAACQGDEICSVGRCTCGAYGERFCPSTGLCMDVRSDDAHCGGCDIACGSGTTCVSGSCRCPGANERLCASTGVCTDVDANDAHCGACDNACPSDASCAGGACQCDTVGEIVCAGACVDPDRDAANCGACGVVCGAGEACRGGVCACPAPTPSPERRIAPYEMTTNFRAARGGDVLGLVYESDRLGVQNVHFRRLDARGAPIGSDVPLTSYTVSSDGVSGSADVVWDGVGWVVVYTEFVSRSPSPHDERLVLRRVHADGTLEPPVVVDSAPGNVGTYNYREPQIAVSPSHGVVMVYRHQASSSLRFRMLGDGTAPGLPLELVGRPSGFSGRAFDVAVSPGGVIGVAYTNAFRVHFQRVEPDGSVLTAPVTMPLGPGVSSSQPTEPAIRWNGSEFLILWGRALSLATDNDQLVACSAPSCVAPTVLHANTSSRFGRRHSDVFLDDAGATLGVGWYDSGFVQAMRIGLPSLSPLEPPYRAPVHDTVPYRFAPPFALLHSRRDEMTLVWDDERWGGAELYSQHFTLPACTP